MPVGYHQPPPDHDDDEEFITLEVDACERTCRALTYTLLSFLFLAESVVFGTGMWMWYNSNVANYVGGLGLNEYLAAVSVLMFAIALAMLAKFAAVFGTFFWNYPLLVTYEVVGLLAIALKVVSATYTLIYGSTTSALATAMIAQRFWDNMYTYSTDMNAKTTIDTIQYNLGCCGAKYPNDWMKIGMWVPNTCRDQVTGNQIHWSCSEMVGQTMEFYSAIMTGIAYITAFLELFGLYFVIVQIAGIRSRRRAIKREEKRNPL